MKLEKTIAFSVEYPLLGEQNAFKTVSRKFTQNGERIWQDQTCDTACMSTFFKPNLFNSISNLERFYETLQESELEELISMMDNTISSLRGILNRHKQNKKSENSQETVNQKEETL